MKQYLIGFIKNTPSVVFFDIKDFEEQNIRGMTVLTFSEDEIDYTYFGNDGKDFKEAHKAAPDFDTYEVMPEQEAKKRGLLKDFPSQNSGQATQASQKPAKGKVKVDFSKDKNNPTITFSDGNEYTLDELLNMSPNKVLQIGKDNSIEIPDLISEINTSMFQGESGKIEIDSNSISQSGNLGNSVATADTPIVQLPDGRMLSLNDIMKMTPEQKKEIEDMAKKMNLKEAKESYYLANRDGSFIATSGTKLSNGLFAHKKDTNFLLWCISDIKSGLLLKSKFKTLKDCKDYVASLPEEDKEKIERVRQGQNYIELCDKLAEYKSEQEGK